MATSRTPRPSRALAGKRDGFAREVIGRFPATSQPGAAPNADRNALILADDRRSARRGSCPSRQAAPVAGR